MALVMDRGERQIAAPKQLEFLPPHLMGPRDPIMRLARASDEDPQGDDFHVLQARRLTERNPTSAAAWARLAQAELGADNLQSAAGAASSALEKMNPVDGAAALAAAIVLVACGRTEEAERALRDLEANGHAQSFGGLRTFRATLAAQRGDCDQALRLVSGLDTPESWSLQGWINLQQRDYANAIRSYRRALKEGRADPEILTNIGYAHAALGQRDRAIRDTQYALSLRPANQSRVGLNLVAYYCADGRFDDAIKVLRTLQEQSPHDLDLWFAEAGVKVSMGIPREAHRTLRRIRTSLWAHLSEMQQAELTSNLAFVGWLIGKHSKKDAASEVLRELRRVDYSAPRLTEMLPPLLDRFSDAKTLREVLVSTMQANPGVRLPFLDVNLAVLERRFDDATTLSVEWVDDEPLNPAPALAATFLLVDVACDPYAASELGLKALRRIPAANALANNVAYALALANRAEEAKSIVPEDQTPQCTATRGLIALCLGDREEALVQYRHALSLAAEANDPDLVALVALNVMIGLQRFGGDLSAEEVALPTVRFSDTWTDQPRFEIIVKKMERLGVQAPQPK